MKLIKKIDLAKYKKMEWVKIFSGYWSLLTCSYLARAHSKFIRENLGYGPHRIIIISRNGFCAAQYDKEDLTEFWKQLAEKIIGDNNLLPAWGKQVKKNTDILTSFVKKQPGDLKIIKKHYKEFLRLFDNYVPDYVAVKQAANSLPKDLFDKFIPLCDEIRVYSEHLYIDTENFMKKIGALISAKTGYNVNLVLSCVPEEFDGYLDGKPLPPKNALKKRFSKNAIIAEDGSLSTIVDKNVDILEKNIIGSTKIAEVKGQPGYKGLVKGRARIILNPNKVKIFNKGDILVTGMTRPEYLPLMKLAGAVVTDAGGVLCHAAVVARELKIPTVIGTEKATKTFKDEDYLEVDARKGTVKKIIKRKGEN